MNINTLAAHPELLLQRMAELAYDEGGSAVALRATHLLLLHLHPGYRANTTRQTIAMEPSKTLEQQLAEQGLTLWELKKICADKPLLANMLGVSKPAAFIDATCDVVIAQEAS